MSLKIEFFPKKATGTGLDGLNQEDFKTEVDGRKRKYTEELTMRAKHDAVMGERINAALRGTR